MEQLYWILALDGGLLYAMLAPTLVLLTVLPVEFIPETLF